MCARRHLTQTNIILQLKRHEHAAQHCECALAVLEDGHVGSNSPSVQPPPGMLLLESDCGVESATARTVKSQAVEALNDLAKKKRAKVSKSSPEKIQPLVPKLDLSLVQVRSALHATRHSLLYVSRWAPRNFLSYLLNQVSTAATAQLCGGTCGRKRKTQPASRLPATSPPTVREETQQQRSSSKRCPLEGYLRSSKFEMTAVLASIFAHPATCCEYYICCESRSATT